MASFLKKLFGKVEQASVQAQNQAKSTTSTASSAADSARSQEMGARHGLSDTAANLQNQAGSTATNLQNQAGATASAAQAKAPSSGNLLSDVVGLFDGGMPNLGEIEAVIVKLSGNELSGILGGAMNSVPADSRNQLGQLVNEKAPTAAAAAPGVTTGNPTDLGAALSSILKGGGISALAGLFGASGASGTAAGGEGINLGAIMNNPLAKQVLSAIVPALMNAAGK